MILAVSIGNTNIRVAAGLLSIVFYANEDNLIEKIEAGLGPVWDKIEKSIIASVVPEKTDMIVTALECKTRKPVRRINIKNCGNLRTDRYNGLVGEDRVVCCAAALYKFTAPLVVIDYGTATTVNVVNRDGEFIGGAILPGLMTGLDALAHNTAQLPQIEKIEGTVKLIGKNTVENLQSGAVIGQACAVEGFIRRIEKELGQKISVIVTGGHAPDILPYCQFECVHEPALLLEGLLALGAQSDT